MAPGGLIVLAGIACSILTASFAVLSSTSSPARAASSLTLTTGLLVAAVWNAVQHGANEWHGGLQPMTLMLEQNLLQMATAHDPSWIAMCDGFVRGTYDDCRWHRLADRPTWSAGLAKSRGRRVAGDGRVEVNLLAAALFLFSEYGLAAARSDFAAVAVTNGMGAPSMDSSYLSMNATNLLKRRPRAAHDQHAQAPHWYQVKHTGVHGGTSPPSSSAADLPPEEWVIRGGIIPRLPPDDDERSWGDRRGGDLRHLSARVAPPDWMWGPTIPNGSGCVLVVPGIGNGGITHQDGSMVQLVGGVGVPAQPSGCVLVGVSLGASGAIGGGQHTASQQTSASGRPSLSQGGAGYIMLGVLEFWWELGGWAMAEFYRELRERPGLQFDLCFMGRTEPLASRSSFTPLHWERKSHASCLHGVAPAPIGVPPACGSAAAVGEVWNNDDGDQIMMASQVSDGLLGGCIPSGTAYSAHAEVMRYMPGSPNSAVANRTRGRAARRPVVEAQAAAPGGGGAQADLGDRAAGAAATAEAAAVEMAQFQAMLESVDAAFEPAGAAGPTHEYLDDDDAAYADALYYWGPVAEARRRAAWEVHIRDEMADAHVCITERECCICFESLGDDSSCGAVCRLACGGGTHLFHATCVGRGWQASGQERCPLCRADHAGTPEGAFVWTAMSAHVAVQAQAAREAADAQAQATWDSLPAATRNDDLDRADPPGAPVAGGWDAIDNYTTLDCVVSPMGHLEDVPQALRADWARANVSVFEEIERAQEAQDEVALERGLKWYLVLHDVLLRGLQRGTRGAGRSANALATRFRLWREGRREELLQSWARDRARGWQRLTGRDGRRHGESEEDRARRSARVLELMRDGEISRAMRLLHSFGIAGITEDILRQMARKHPPRQHSVPQQLPGPAAPAVAPMELTETFRGLRRRAGTGVSGRRNEYLRALVGDFNDARADEVMGRYSTFATAAMNVTFPPWFYSAWAISGLMPLVKSRLSPEQLRQGVQPDARPVAVGETDLRAILRNLTDTATAAAAEVLAPEQLAVGVSGGISVLIHGIRLILEARRTFVCVRLDMSNGYNACSRSVLLRRLSEHAGLEHLVPPLHALGAEAPDLLIGAQRQRLFADAQRGDSEEGTGQGQPHSSLAFCTCIQPELRALSKELEPFDGGAKAIMDDVYVFGPAAQVFPAIERFVSALRRLTGLQINQGKSACFSRGYNLEGCPWRQRAGVPVGTVALAGVDGAAGPGTGIMVGGVPIGEPAFVTEVMRALVAGDVSYIETTVTQLRDQPHAAWAALFYSCAPRFDYWLRHMPPNETVQHAAVFDRAMLQAAEQLGYVGMMHDPLTRRRFRLPARMRGCGIRSRAWLAPIAFTACFVEAVEGMMGVTDAGLPALFEQLTDVFGVGAFAPGGGRFHTFLRDYRALLPTASAFASGRSPQAYAVAEPSVMLSL